jgi:hypothetical protein
MMEVTARGVEPKHYHVPACAGRRSHDGSAPEQVDDQDEFSGSCVR